MGAQTVIQCNQAPSNFIKLEENLLYQTNLLVKRPKISKNLEEIAIKEILALRKRCICASLTDSKCLEPEPGVPVCTHTPTLDQVTIAKLQVQSELIRNKRIWSSFSIRQEARSWSHWRLPEATDQIRSFIFLKS